MSENRSGRTAACDPARRSRALRPAGRLVIIAAALSAAPAWARQPAQRDSSPPRVPGFDMPRPPQDPPFPVLPGVFGEMGAGPADRVPPVVAPQSPTPVTPLGPLAAPPAETRDRAVEDRIGAGRGREPADGGDESAWHSGIIALFAGLAAAAVLVLVTILRNRGRVERGPASIVRDEPAVGRIAPRTAADARRDGHLPKTDRSPSPTRRAAVAADSPTPPAC